MSLLQDCVSVARTEFFFIAIICPFSSVNINMLCNFSTLEGNFWFKIQILHIMNFISKCLKILQYTSYRCILYVNCFSSTILWWGGGQKRKWGEPSQVTNSTESLLQAKIVSSKNGSVL